MTSVLAFAATAWSLVGKSLGWLIKNPWVPAVVLFLIVCAIAWTEHGALAAARANLKAERTAFATERGLFQGEQRAFAACEHNRSLEHQAATTSIGDIETACAVRVAAARRAGSLIRQIVETPVVEDPQTHCPVRGVIGADQLRHAAGLP